MKRKSWNLVLASQSPRRIEILKRSGLAYSVLPSNSSELFRKNLSLDQNLRAVAIDKAQGTLAQLSPRKLKGKIILSGDTVVVIGKKVLGKPKSRNDAKRMLRLLRGKTHSVKTSFCLLCPDENVTLTRVVTTKVGFRKISDEELNWYLDSNEYHDKAGSYAIQGLAQGFVNAVKGDLLNVVGLPFFAVREELKKKKWHVRSRK